MVLPGKKYERRIDGYKKLNGKQAKAVNLISNIRLLVFVIGVAAALALFFTKNYILCAAIAIAAAIGFIWLVLKHTRIIEKNQYCTLLQKINEDSCNRVSDNWKDFKDTGEEFYNEDHPYSADLDIFGRGSLFQLISTAYSTKGKKQLKKLLTGDFGTIEDIKARQPAVNELAGYLTWRQHFQAESMMSSRDMRDPEKLLIWAEDRQEVYTKKYFRITVKLLPIFTVLMVLAALVHLILIYIPAALLAVQLVMLRIGRKKRVGSLLEAVNYKDDIRIYYNMLKRVETRKFSSNILNALKKRLENNRGIKAYKQIDKLVKIADSINNRNNIFYFIINLLGLWDYQCALALESWKSESGSRLRDWLEVLGEFEAICSLAVINHDHPEWTVPEITGSGSFFDARCMGHPLLGDSRVCNDLRIVPPESILLITGSNMSGKSTLLRTSGINLVLAYAGSRVCAATFKCSIMDIHTCMRVKDSLERNISSFYAEILRVKSIVNALEGEKPLFFLLDEIFKGTNSMDRHTGAKILIKKLSRGGAAGLVSTHDLELAELEKENPGRIGNYHFKEYYRNNEIKFDYKLQKGVSKTRNAMYLMKMAGIEDDGD